MGIEPTLGPNLGHTGYKSVGASSYTNLPFKFGDDRGTRTLTLKEQGFLRPLWLPLHHIVKLLT